MLFYKTSSGEYTNNPGFNGRYDMELIQRFELKIPKEGNRFIQLPHFFGSDESKQIFLRVVSGHSFLSGNDVVFFDGHMLLELRVSNVSERKLKLTPAMVGNLIIKMRRALKFGKVSWDAAEKAISIDLMEDVNIPINESSVKILKQLEKVLQIPKNNLVKQADWFLKMY